MRRQSQEGMEFGVLQGAGFYLRPPLRRRGPHGTAASQSFSSARCRECRHSCFRGGDIAPASACSRRLADFLAWGGTQAVLTLPLRIASLAAAAILALSAIVIRRRARLSGTGPPGRLVKVLSWAITIYLLLNTLANLGSPSNAEKIVFGPISLVLAVSCLIISSSRLAD